MDLGVDGIIADYPTRLRTLMVERGLKLPPVWRFRDAQHGRQREQAATGT